MTHLIDIVILVLLFVGGVVKERVDSAARATTRRKSTGILLGYWVIVVVVLAFGITKHLVDWRSKRAETAKRLDLSRANHYYEAGKDQFKRGLGGPDGKPSDPLLESSILKLTVAAELYRQAGQDVTREIACRTAVALAREKLAYLGGTSSTVYYVERGRIARRVESRGDDIRAKQESLKPALIRCTPIMNRRHWDNARAQYIEVSTLIRQGLGDRRLEKDDCMGMIMSARSAAYFFICDRLLNAQDRLDEATELLKSIRGLTSPTEMNLPGRHSDAIGKLEFIRHLRHGG